MYNNRVFNKHLHMDSLLGMYKRLFINLGKKIINRNEELNSLSLQLQYLEFWRYLRICFKEIPDLKNKEKMINDKRTTLKLKG